MTRALIINVTTSGTIPGSDQFLEEPAMGNMKATTPGYDEKRREKLAKQLIEMQYDAKFAFPQTVHWIGPFDQSSGTDPLRSEFAVKTGTVEEFIKVAQEFSVLRPVDMILGTHPSTHSEMLIRWCLRRECSIPGCLRLSVERQNIWRLLNIDYPKGCQLAGIIPTDPCTDTLSLLAQVW